MGLHSRSWVLRSFYGVWRYLFSSFILFSGSSTFMLGCTLLWMCKLHSLSVVWGHSGALEPEIPIRESGLAGQIEPILPIPLPDFGSNFGQPKKCQLST
jgi:hypothetical protein